MIKILLDEKHIYTVDGKVTKSVTQILAEEGLTKYWNRDPFYLEKGQAIHTASHLIDIDSLDWDSVDERIKGYLEAYMLFKQQSGLVFEHIEESLYHKLYDYAGTPDRFNNDGVLMDIKAGESFPLQLEGYGELIRANGYPLNRDADMLNLKEDSTYSLKPYKFNRTEKGVFLSAVILNNYKGGRNGKRI